MSLAPWVIANCRAGVLTTRERRRTDAPGIYLRQAHIPPSGSWTDRAAAGRKYVKHMSPRQQEKETQSRWIMLFLSSYSPEGSLFHF